MYSVSMQYHKAVLMYYLTSTVIKKILLEEFAVFFIVYYVSLLVCEKILLLYRYVVLIALSDPNCPVLNGNQKGSIVLT